MCVIFIRSIKANSCYFHTSLVMQIIRSGRAKCFLFYPLATAQSPKPILYAFLQLAFLWVVNIEMGGRGAYMIIVIIRKANYDNLSQHIPSIYSLVNLWIRCIMFDTTQQKTLRMLPFIHPCSVTNRLYPWLWLGSSRSSFSSPTCHYANHTRFPTFH